MTSSSSSLAERETLSFVRKCRHSDRPSKGLIFRNFWLTGWDDLVFSSVEAARNWAAARNARFISPGETLR